MKTIPVFSGMFGLIGAVIGFLLPSGAEGINLTAVQNAGSVSIVTSQISGLVWGSVIGIVAGAIIGIIFDFISNGGR